jgi:hypothetical protein
MSKEKKQEGAKKVNPPSTTEKQKLHEHKHSDKTMPSKSSNAKGGGDTGPGRKK